MKCQWEGRGHMHCRLERLAALVGAGRKQPSGSVALGVSVTVSEVAVRF